MRRVTRGTLAKLLRADWFSQSGSKKGFTNAIFLSSWEEAEKSCTSVKWENTCLEADNLLREAIFLKSVPRVHNWNNVVDQLYLKIMPLVKKKLSKMVSEKKFPESFKEEKSEKFLKNFLKRASEKDPFDEDKIPFTDLEKSQFAEALGFFQPGVHWEILQNIIQICLGTEYSDLVPSEFSDLLLQGVLRQTEFSSP